jgi:hypothetical protein
MGSKDFDLPNAVALLRRTPATLSTLLRGLPDAWTRASEGDGTWTAYDVAGHLVHAEHTDWMVRVRHILEHGDTQAFPAFDRTAQFQESRGRSLEDLLEEFATARAENLDALEALRLTATDFARRGLHPSLGPVTLGNLLATWTAHDLTHLHQISRVMAMQYKQAVGPWDAFLGVMHCNGHSS